MSQWPQVGGSYDTWGGEIRTFMSQYYDLNTGLTLAGSVPYTALANMTSANLASKITDETGSGPLVFANAPTLTSPILGVASATSLTTQQIIGGTAVGSSLDLQSTSGIGTTDYVRCLVGNNGGTEAWRVTNSGMLLVGLTTPTSTVNKIEASYAPTTYPAGATLAYFFNTSAAGEAGGTSDFRSTTSQITATGTANLVAVTGFVGNALVSLSSGTVTTASGVSGTARNTSAGLLSNAYGCRGQILLTSTGNITTATCIAALSPSITGTGVITTLRGVYIQAQTAAGVTNAFGVYQEGASDINYFAGKTGFSTTAPTQIISLGGGSARTIWMERHTTANTAGNSLTLQAGGATPGSTNKSGGDLILQPGLGTGNATPALGHFLFPAQGTASGTADQSLVRRLVLNGTGSLTSGTAKTLLTIPLATLQMGSGVVMYSIEASDGVDVISASGEVYFSAVNKAGTYTTSSSLLGTEAISKSDGTDTIVQTFGFSNGANQTSLQITSTLTGMTATTYRITYQVVSGAQQSITVP